MPRRGCCVDASTMHVDKTVVHFPKKIGREEKTPPTGTAIMNVVYAFGGRVRLSGETLEQKPRR